MRSVIRLDQTATNAAAAIRQITTRERTDVVTADLPCANPRGRGSGDLAGCATPFLSFAGWSRRSPNGPQSPDVKCAVHGVRSCSGTGSHPLGAPHRPAQEIIAAAPELRPLRATPHRCDINAA